MYWTCYIYCVTVYIQTKHVYSFFQKILTSLVVLLWLSLVKIVMNNIIDTHFHIWDLGLRLKYQKTDGSFDWPDESLSTIHRNILADEAAREFQKSKVEAAIFVQCLNGSQEEIKWVEDLSSSYPVIKGIVGGIDLSQVNQSTYFSL